MNYYDKEKLKEYENGNLIFKVNCKYCLPCGICELKSSFDKKELCNEFMALTMEAAKS